MKWKIIILALFPLLLLTGCTIGWTDVYSRYIGVYNKYDDAIRGLGSQVKKGKNDIKEMGYLILIGIAYQRKGLLDNSMKYYEKSLALNNRFNYFALLQKAKLYKIEGKQEQERSNLKLAITCIENLKKAIANKSVSAEHIKRYKILDFNIGYYIYHENHSPLFIGNEAQQKKAYFSCLDRRIEVAKALLQADGK